MIFTKLRQKVGEKLASNEEGLKRRFRFWPLGVILVLCFMVVVSITLALIAFTVRNKGCSTEVANQIKSYRQNIKRDVSNLFRGLNISVLAPASRSLTEDWKNFTSLSFWYPPDIFEDGEITLFANNDEMRLKHFLYSVNDDNTDIIWCVRGGYGSARLIPALMKMEPPKKEKFFIGKGDITSLHLFLAQKWGWQTIHGPLFYDFVDFDKNDEGFARIGQIITQPDVELVTPGLVALNPSAANLTDTLFATMIGGNLALVQTSLGTEYFCDPAGKILFLEDVKIKAYELDRMLNHLLQSILREDKPKPVAIVFGVITAFNDYNAKLMPGILNEFSNSFLPDVPVFQTDFIGNVPINHPIVYNRNYTISRNSRNSKTFDLTLKKKL